jgi:SnoaL-like domain
MTNGILRRSFLKRGVLPILLGATSASAWCEQGAAPAAGAQARSERSRDETIRAYYSGWEKKHWGTVENLLADNFTFTSPNDDDHIDKRAFKERCWPGADSIGTIKMESIVVHGDEGFAKYLLSTKDGKSIRNTEYFRFTDNKVRTIEVYFGGKWGYPEQQA